MPAGNESAGRKGTTLDRVYAELRRAILGLELEPGSNLDESALVAKLNVSRTPVREAFLRLANDGLVTISPNRGAYVSSIELSRVREFFEALELAQRVATRWAAIRRTALDLERIERCRVEFENAAAKQDIPAMIEANISFHRSIAAACRNSYVADEYAYLLTLGFRLSQMALRSSEKDSAYYDKDHLKAIIDEHRRMAVSIARKDAEAADRLARDHVRLFRDQTLRHLGHSLAEHVEL